MATAARWMNAGALACLAAAAGGATCAAAPALSQGRAEELALSTLGLEIFIGLLAVALAVGTSVPIRRRLGLLPGRLTHLHVALLVLGTVALSYGIDGVLEWTRLRQESAMAEIDQTLSGVRGRALWVIVGSLALAPALSEELLCRGFVQRGLELRYGPALAIPLTALFFGALHVEPIHAVAAGLLGLYLGAVAWLAGGIRASILCHLVNNLTAVAGATFGRLVPSTPWTLAGAFAFSALALAVVWRRAGAPPRLAAPLDGSRGTGTSSRGLQPHPGSDDP